jgi:hypothetical protein
MAGMSQLLVTGRDFGSGKFTERDAGFDGHPQERQASMCMFSK